MEKFWCVNCGHSDTLTIHGECQHCGSTAVMPAALHRESPYERYLAALAESFDKVYGM